MNYSMQIEILKSTGMSEYDARHHNRQGVCICEVDECIKFFDGFAYELDEEHRKELLDFLTAKKDGSSLWGNDLTYFDGVAYYIEYVL